MPSWVKPRMRSVTISASPRRIALKRSPLGTRQRRWSHGSYGAVKSAGSKRSAPTPFSTPWSSSFLASVGEALAELEQRLGQQHVLGADQPVGELVGQPVAQGVGELVHPGRDRDPRRRALEHRDVLGLAGHRRHQGDRGGAAADDHDALAGVLQVLGPELRVHDLAAEVGDARDGRGVGLGVVVVARAGVEERAGHGGALGGPADSGSVDSTVTVQRWSAVDQSAATTRRWRRMWRSMPCLAAVCSM